MKFFLIFIIIFSNLYAKSISDVMDEILDEPKRNECKFTKKASILMLDKTEGKSEIAEVIVGTDFEHQTLKIKITKCCLSADQSYGFIKIENLKLKREIFKGWLFSKNATKNSLQDPKFDITLLRCF